MVAAYGEDAMTKVVINRTYGGFCLTDAATRRYCDLAGVLLPEIRPGDHREGMLWYSLEERVKRTDPLLVQVVEEMPHHDLLVVDIASGVLYRIREYDGA